MRDKILESRLRDSISDSTPGYLLG